ncbi:hypothetical protein KJ359_005148 [Pestalotiopsis sp. 9143b]|nr:hypothetical protein KJ359_005148 [Pestalotiopsis sp. 9143b]
MAQVYCLGAAHIGMLEVFLHQRGGRPSETEMGAFGRLKYLFTRAGLALRTLFEDEEKDIMGSEDERSKHRNLTFLTAITPSGGDEECLRIIADTLQANCRDFMLNIY